MKLLQRLLRRKPQPISVLTPLESAELALSVERAKAPPLKPKGRVIKQTRTAEFNPDPLQQRGRIVKVMPRQLQKIKQAQEKVESDSLPRLEDLED
jgi:hypothetical protein